MKDTDCMWHGRLYLCGVLCKASIQPQQDFMSSSALKNCHMLHEIAILISYSVATKSDDIQLLTQVQYPAIFTAHFPLCPTIIMKLAHCKGTSLSLTHALLPVFTSRSCAGCVVLSSDLSCWLSSPFFQLVMTGHFA